MSMEYLLSGERFERARGYMEEAARIARQALCLRAKCGTVIVKGDEIIGVGYNSPAGGVENSRCNWEVAFTHKPKSDRTCCMHAEWRAILDAVRNRGEEVRDAELFFMRVDEEGLMTKAGKPYCTVCSRLALDVGIRTFYLWHEEGIAGYPTDEYDRMSYAFVSQVK